MKKGNNGSNDQQMLISRKERDKLNQKIKDLKKDNQNLNDSLKEKDEIIINKDSKIQEQTSKIEELTKTIEDFKKEEKKRETIKTYLEVISLAGGTVYAIVTKINEWFPNWLEVLISLFS